MIYSKRTPGAIALYPNREKLMKFISHVKGIVHASQNLSAIELINKLNPVIRG